MSTDRDMMQTLVAKLYATITGNDPNIKIPRNKFVTWMAPGIPFSTSDFEFCQTGFTGATAEDVLLKYHQAYSVSKLFDYVPEINNQFVDETLQQGIFSTSQDTISSIYKDILTYSKVVNFDIEPKMEQKLKDLRNKLVETKEVIDIITDEKKLITEPSPLTKAYNDKLKEYIDAAEDYMNLLINAQSATGSDPEAKRRVAEFANKQKLYIRKLQAAESAWISQGYKNEYEQINAFIQNVTQRSMVAYKQDLQSKFEMSKLASPADGGSEFYYTTLIPGNFAESNAWTKFSFYEGDTSEFSNKSFSNWKAEGSGGMKLFGISAKASGSNSKESLDTNTSNFKASFEYSQVIINRPFFEPGFFMMRGWKLDEYWNLNYNNMPVSDGAINPSGRLVAYPTAALFVRNVRFEFDEAKSHFEKIKKQLDIEGSVGWGPFKVGGGYSKGSENSKSTSHIEGNSIVIDGMQLIGTINNLIPTCPNTNPEIAEELYV